MIGIFATINHIKQQSTPLIYKFIYNNSYIWYPFIFHTGKEQITQSILYPKLFTSREEETNKVLVAV